jgi:hypothetical protein
MRLLALAGLVALLSACGPGIEEEAAPTPSDSQESTQMGPPESWCRSYTSQRYCPSVCFWYSSPAPGYCGLKPTSVASEIEEDVTQMGPPESWCRSYTSQRYCPSVCVWYSYPAPGYCGVPSES